MKIPRYEVMAIDSCETDDGVWCKWEDVQAALKANERLRRLSSAIDFVRVVGNAPPHSWFEVFDPETNTVAVWRRCSSPEQAEALRGRLKAVTGCGADPLSKETEQALWPVVDEEGDVNDFKA